MNEEVFLEKYLVTKDNIKIAINHYYKSQDSVIILAHGWYMTKDSAVFKEMSERFFEQYDVITMDFRGHGRSQGAYTFSAKEPMDLEAVVNYAKQHYSKIYLIGFSLGAAISIIHTAKNNDIDGLIMVSPPTSFDKIEGQFWRKEAIIPTIQKFELERSLSIRPGNILLEKINPIEVIGEINSIPIMIIAGEKDPTIFPWHAEALYVKANEPKKLMIIENTIHAEDIYLSDKEKFINICTTWLSNKNTA